MSNYSLKEDLKSTFAPLIKIFSKKRKKLSAIDLPEAIKTKVWTQILFAAAICIATILLLLLYKDLRCCSGFLIALLLVAVAIKTIYDFDDDKFEETVLMCYSVHKKQRHTLVVFCTLDEEYPRFFEYKLSVKSFENFEEGQTYIVYYVKDRPKELVGYKAL